VSKASYTHTHTSTHDMKFSGAWYRCTGYRRHSLSKAGSSYHVSISWLLRKTRMIANSNENGYTSLMESVRQHWCSELRSRGALSNISSKQIDMMRWRSARQYAPRNKGETLTTIRL